MIRYVVLLLVQWHSSCYAQGSDLINYDFENVDNLISEKPKNMMVFLTADWCQFCQNMKVNTFANDQVIKFLNEHFYFVPFNVELDKKVTFKGVEYNSSKIDYHELAQAISGQKRCTLPYIAIIDAQNEVLYESEGFVGHKTLNEILITFKE